MSDPAQQSMDADAFVAWAIQQPRGKRYELANGEVVAMAPERSGHARLKGLIVRPRQRVIVHHARDPAGEIATRIVRDGFVRLDPPGITLDWPFPS